jgi:hypothetical protein
MWAKPEHLERALELAARDYRIELVEEDLSDGADAYRWIASYPDVEGCHGCGDTREEAVRDLVWASIEMFGIWLEYGPVDPPPLSKGPAVVSVSVSHA